MAIANASAHGGFRRGMTADPDFVSRAVFEWWWHERIRRGPIPPPIEDPAPASSPHLLPSPSISRTPSAASGSPLASHRPPPRLAGGGLVDLGPPASLDHRAHRPPPPPPPAAGPLARADGPRGNFLTDLWDQVLLHSPTIHPALPPCRPGVLHRAHIAPPKRMERHWMRTWGRRRVDERARGGGGGGLRRRRRQWAGLLDANCACARPKEPARDLIPAARPPPRA